MTDEQTRRLEWLRQALESGTLDEGAYRTLVAALEGQTAVALGDRAQAAADRSAVAQRIDAPVVTGDGSLAAGGHVIFATDGATVVIGEAPVAMTAVDRVSALGRYLHHVISRNRYLQLQGIRSGGRLVHIELDQVYVTLRATRQRLVEAEEAWLAQEVCLAPGEAHRRGEYAPVPRSETVTVSVNEALDAHGRLVVLGDPGSGKTTLLRYLALLYARDLAEGSTLVPDKLGLAESGRLPILLPLRQIGAYLRARHAVEDGTEGCAQLLEFLIQSVTNERIELPAGIFEEWLDAGRAVVLFDGLDEVADPDLRRRVSRLVEAFTRAYPGCRYVVTSRIVGYTGPARLGEGYATTTVRDFTMADVEHFLANWHRLVAVGLMGPGASAESYAVGQTRQLLAAIEANERVRELAINPLMLIVIAMVHRDRVKLPDRRAELYAEAVDVLLGKWEEAKGVVEIPILEGQTFDTGDRRLVLQAVALRMHEAGQKEVAVGELRRWLGEMFHEIVGDRQQARRAVDHFLRVIEERTGLLVARGEGVYAFSHLTFQEYLAALAVAARDDYVAYILTHTAEPWWREVILLEAGHLSTQSKERTTYLIQAIVDLEQEPEPYHNLVLAAECLQDVGAGRVGGDLWAEIHRRIRNDVEYGHPVLINRIVLWLGMSRPVRGIYRLVSRRFSEITRRRISATVRVGQKQRVAASRALARIGGAYWIPPYGEPEWVSIPDGGFMMGTPESRIPTLIQELGGQQEWYMWEIPQHQVNLPAYFISRVPITNAQYRFFVEATGYAPPKHWVEGRPLKGLESHPVVWVSWHDAMAYCRWLSDVTGKSITLPSEAEWEKASRADRVRLAFPWGESFDPMLCNSREFGLGGTTPVGIFPGGASPYGVLDMSGNVWEWTRSLWGRSADRPDYVYPYDAKDGREVLVAGDEFFRGVRGGSFGDGRAKMCCTLRHADTAGRSAPWLGFRVVAIPLKAQRSCSQ